MENKITKVLINNAFIKKWEAKYDKIEKDEEEYQAILKMVKKNIEEKDTLNKTTFIRILNWKAPRVKGIIDLDNYKEYASSIKKCVSDIRSDEEKLVILGQLRGIGVPVASTILHFIFPKTFPIMDIRTAEVLYEDGYIKSDKRDQKRFSDFRDVIKKIQRKFPRWSLRKIDRALFAYHKIELKHKDCILK